MHNQKINATISRKSIDLILAERVRQSMVEDYTIIHDDEHTEGQLALLAAAYVLSSREDLLGPSMSTTRKSLRLILMSYRWSFKPKDPIRDLIRAGALILAELDRRLRLQKEV